MTELNFTKISKEKEVYLSDKIVLKPKYEWTESVHKYLDYLRNNGVTYVPLVLGYDEKNNEKVRFIEGEFIHPNVWPADAIVNIGRVLRELHEISKGYKPSQRDVWQPWFLRNIGNNHKIISHGDFAPWNIVTKKDSVIGIIDWEFAGPIDPIAELARACWLFIQLYDKDVEETIVLPPLEKRCSLLRLLLDSYGATTGVRKNIMEYIVKVSVYETAEQAIGINVKQDTAGDLWGISWRARSAKWILEHRDDLEKTLK